MDDEKRQGRKVPRSYVHEDRYVLVIDGQRKCPLLIRMSL